MSNPKLSLEILNGPLDGQVIILKETTDWSKEGDGPLSFPWDEELGTPQARFFLEDESWWIESKTTPHSTYAVKREGRIKGKIHLEPDEILKASDTWLLVKQIK